MHFFLKRPVIVPSSAAYQRARLAYNERFDAIRPLAIFRPLSLQDVRQAVLWARQFGVELAVRSGGHSYGGYSTSNGLVVDLRALNSISLGPTGLATIGAGARLIDVEAGLARRGRAIPSGSCATVGVGGLALGGGVGFSSRKFGTTSDHIVSVEIVTADGRARTCSGRENADLFWASRGGGGGNFGVVTRFTFRTHAVGLVTFFVLDWPWQQAREALLAWQRSAPHGPDELFSVCALRTGTPSHSRVVVFTSRASNLVRRDRNQQQDVFRRNLVSGMTRRVAADESSFPFPIVADDITPGAGTMALTTRAELRPKASGNLLTSNVYTLTRPPPAP